MRALVIAAVFLGSSSLDPPTRKTKEKLRRLPHRKRLLLKTRRTLRPSRINGRKPDSPRPTTVKSVGTGEYIPTMVTAGIAMIVWAVITVIGECIEIVRQIE